MPPLFQTTRVSGRGMSFQIYNKIPYSRRKKPKAFQHKACRFFSIYWLQKALENSSPHSVGASFLSKRALPVRCCHTVLYLCSATCTCTLCPLRESTYTWNQSRSIFQGFCLSVLFLNITCNFIKLIKQLLAATIQ